MELKTARLTLLIDPTKKAAFERLCARLDLTPSQVVRQLIRDYLAQHDVSYATNGPKMKADLKSNMARTPRTSAAAAKSRKGR